MHNPKQFFYGLKIIAFLSEHPKSDQNLKFLLLKVTTSNTVIFIWESGIQTIVKKLHRVEIHSSLKLSRTALLGCPSHPRVFATLLIGNNLVLLTVDFR